MVNQGQNHIDSPANMLQQQASYEVSDDLIFFRNSSIPSVVDVMNDEKIPIDKKSRILIALRF